MGCEGERWNLPGRVLMVGHGDWLLDGAQANLEVPAEMTSGDGLQVIYQMIPNPVDNDGVFGRKNKNVLGLLVNLKRGNPGFVLFIAEHLKKVRLKFRPFLHCHREAYH